MKTKAAVLAAATTLITAISSMALATDPASIAGTWMLEDGSMAIEIAPCGDGLCGTLTWLQGGGETGMVVLSNLPLEPSGKGVFKGGEFTDVASGRTYYRVELRLQDDGKLRLQGMAGVMREGRLVTSRFPTTFRFSAADRSALTGR